MHNLDHLVARFHSSAQLYGKRRVSFLEQANIVYVSASVVPLRSRVIGKERLWVSVCVSNTSLLYKSPKLSELGENLGSGERCVAVCRQ